VDVIVISVRSSSSKSVRVLKSIFCSIIITTNQKLRFTFTKAADSFPQPSVRIFKDVCAKRAIGMHGGETDFIIIVSRLTHALGHGY
jgi:hypothetical protein